MSTSTSTTRTILRGKSNTHIITIADLDVVVRRQEQDVQHTFQQLREYHDARYGAIETAIRDMGDFNRMYQTKASTMDSYNRISQAKASNGFLTRGWNKITVVGAMKVHGDGMLYTEPTYSPKTVGRFWRLQDKKNFKKLCELLTFYDVQDYRYWDDCGTDSDNEVNISLQTAAQQHPKEAHISLGLALGLNYDHIAKFMDAVDLFDRIKREPERKRLAPVPSPGSPDSKRAVAWPLAERIPFEKLVNPISTKDTSEVSEPDRLGWRFGPSSSEDTKRRRPTVNSLRRARGTLHDCDTDLPGTQRHSIGPSSFEGEDQGVATTNHILQVPGTLPNPDADLPDTLQESVDNRHNVVDDTSMGSAESIKSP